MTTRDQGLNREQILDVALDLFAARGFDATTTREITDRLGVTPAALYYHFADKAACLEALVEPYVERVEALVRDADGPLSTRRQAQVFLRAYGDIITRSPRVAGLVEGDPAVRTHPELGPRVARVTEQVRLTLAGPNPTELDLVRASAAIGALRRPRLQLGSDADAVVDAAVAALGDLEG